MLGSWAYSLAVRMARRNGQVLARMVAQQLRKQARQNPNEPPADRWRRLLGNRRGWHELRPDVYEFHTGERLELRAKANPQELIREIAAIELKPLGSGLSPALRDQLMKESLSAVESGWRQWMKP
jgi:hypothetical protein